MGEYISKDYIFVWDDEKEKVLKQGRGLSFWDVIHAMEQGDALLNFIHNNLVRYPNQKKLIVMIREYPHEVPYAYQDNILFLKTIIPNRKYNHILPYEG